MIKKIILSVLFLLSNLLVYSAAVPELSINIPLVYRSTAFRIDYLLLLIIWLFIWKLAEKKKIGEISLNGAFQVIIASLYMPLCGLLMQIWSGVALSRIYILYIYAFAVLFVSITAALTLKSLSSGGVTGSAMSSFFLYFVYVCAKSGRYGFIAIFILALLAFLSIVKAAMNSKVRSYFTKQAANIFSLRNLMIIIFIFAALIRIVFLLNLLSIEGPNYIDASDDGRSYDAAGWKAVSDPLLYVRESPHYFFVFYSVLLTLIYKLFGHSYLAAGIVQSLIGAGLCVLVLYFTYKITNNKIISFMAAFGLAIDSAFIFLFATLNTEVLYLPFLTLAIFFLYKYMEVPSDKKSLLFTAASGIMLGLSTIIRTIAIGMLPFIALWILFYGRKREAHNIPWRILDIVLLSSLAILTISPITYINYKNTGKFFLVYDTRGAAEWAYLSKQYYKGEKVIPDNKPLIDLGMTDPVNDPAGSFKAVISKPRAFLLAYSMIVPGRVRNLFLWPNFGNFDPILLTNPARLPSGFSEMAEFYLILFFAACFLSFLILSKVKRSVKWLLFLVIIYYTILHGVFFVSASPRYASPMKPMITIITAIGSFTMIRFLAQPFISNKALQRKAS